MYRLLKILNNKNIVLLRNKLIINNNIKLLTNWQRLHYENIIFSQTTKTILFSNKYCTQFPKVEPLSTSLIDLNTFDNVCTDTLESLCDYFEELCEATPHLKSADVTYSDGVLTINFGSPYGTYVINRQTPNRQIWLSSPTTGPKRYDFIPIKNQNKYDLTGTWTYKHDNDTLHNLLQKEIAIIVKKNVEFLKLPFSQT